MPRVNVTFARQEFHAVTQQHAETVQQFVTRLRQAGRDCAFGADMDNQIRDAVMARCSSTYVRRRLLEEGNGLTLVRALEVAMLCERVEQQMTPSHEGAATGKTETVNHIGQKRGSEKKTKKQSQQTSKLEQRCCRCGNTGHKKVP